MSTERVTGVNRDGFRDRDLDGLDGALVRALQTDGRSSISELAALLGVSRDIVSHRLRLLTEREGLKIVAALDPGLAGHHVLVHVKAEVEGPVAPVAREVAALQDAVFVSIASGPFPLVFESRHGDLSELHELLDRVRRLPAVRRLQVSTYADVLQGFFVSDAHRDIALDTLDYELVAVLQQDGRASYRTLADAVHLSPSSVRARVRRLVDAGAIRISAIASGGISRNRLSLGLGVTTSGDPEPVRQHLLDSADIAFAARAHGSYDYIGTLVGTSAGHLIAVMDELRMIPSVSSVDSWTHYDVVKEDYARTLGRVLPQ